MYTGIPPSQVFPTDFDQASYLVPSQGPHISPFNEDNFIVSSPDEQDQADPNPPPNPVPQRHSNQGSSKLQSVLSMPIPGTKLAPEKFRGDFHKIVKNAKHYLDIVRNERNKQ